ncbi:MAG TPA: helix-turn-helix domain-containing protein [Terriglobales bacterium]
MPIKLDPERLTKKQVCSILQIGYSTLGKWMARGKIKFRREQADKFESAVFFRRADLAEFLPSASNSDAQPTAGLSPAVPTAPAVPSTARPESRDIRTWAEKYKDGDAADSAGNTIDGANERWPTTGATLLGPVVRVEQAPLDPNGHMEPGLLGSTATNPVNADGYANDGNALAPGLTPEQYRGMMLDWRRRGGGLSEQELAIKLSNAVITRNFPGRNL